MKYSKPSVRCWSGSSQRFDAFGELLLDFDSLGRGGRDECGSSTDRADRSRFPHAENQQEV